MDYYRIVSLFIVLLCPLIVKPNNNITLSPNAQISIITCSPGVGFYDAFGHSAIRVNDPKINLDLTFSYGAFDFTKRNLLMDFILGKLEFMLIIERTDNFINGYKQEKRKVEEAVLSIELHEKQSLFNSLMEHAKIENRDYPYDFFKNNCATKIRDAIIPLNNGIKLNYSEEFHEQDITMRSLLSKYIADRYWAKFMFDLFSGMPADKRLSPQKQAFLPDYLKKSILNGSYQNMKLINDNIVLADKVQEKTKQNSIFSPSILLPFLIVLLIAFGLLSGATTQKTVISIFMLITGMVGLMILWLSLFLNQEYTYNNLNILWSLPFNIIVIPALFSNKKMYEYSLKFLKIYGFYLLGLIFILPFLPQFFSPTIYLILFFLGVGIIILAKKLT